MSNERTKLLEEIVEALSGDSNMDPDAGTCFISLADDLELNRDERNKVFNTIGKVIKGKKTEHIFYTERINDCINEFAEELSRQIRLPGFHFYNGEFKESIRKTITEQISKWIEEREKREH